MSWSEYVDIGMGVLNLGSTIRSSNKADSLTGASEGLVNQEIARNNELADLYAAGGTSISNAISGTLANYGDFGQITPDIIDGFTNFTALNRANEEAGNKREVDDLTAYDIARLNGMEDMFREYADVRLNEADDEIYYRDRYARMMAPKTTDFVEMQGDLTGRFMQMRQENTQRALDNQYAKALANIPEGMENSTLRVQMERASADLSAQRYNEDMLASVTDAQNYIAGLQGAASNQQNMTNAERNMARSLTTDKLNYGTTTLSNTLKAGQYGQDYYTNENAMTGRNIAELSAQQGMRNNTAIMDYTNALNLAGAENTLANDFLNQKVTQASAPIAFSAGGQAQLSNSNSINTLATMAANQQTLANQGATGLGQWWHDASSKYQW